MDEKMICNSCKEKPKLKGNGVCRDCKNARARELYAQDPKTKLKTNLKYKEKNREKIAKTQRDYVKRNPGYNRSASAKYRASKLKADLGFPTKEIYDSCPEGYEVDHIIPLKGVNICGLHVPWNLEAIPADENRRKNNRYDPDRIVPGGMRSKPS